MLRTGDSNGTRTTWPPDTIRRPALLAQLVEHLHGKEGVDGSSPSEGFGKPRMAGLYLERDLHDLQDAQLWSTSWSSQIAGIGKSLSAATGQTRAAVREDPRALSSGTDFRPAEVRASAWAVNVPDQKR